MGATIGSWPLLHNSVTTICTLSTSKMYRVSKLALRSPSLLKTQLFSTATKSSATQLFHPTEEHVALRQMLRSFVESEVDPQALVHNRTETFNVELFRKLGSLGLLGITVEPEYGGSGMDATAACIAHGMSSLHLFFKTKY